MKKYPLVFYLFITTILVSCQTREELKNNNIIKFALEEILKRDRENLLDIYYQQPLKIFPYEVITIDSPLLVRNKQCKIMSKDANTYDLIRNMDIYKPLPLVEIIAFKSKVDSIKLTVVFRSTGHAYDLILKKQAHNRLKILHYNAYKI